MRTSEGESISIAEFNHRYKTSFTLDDVYGKGYLDSLSIADKEKFETPESLESGFSVNKDAEDDKYTPFYKAFVTAREDENYSSIIDYLSDDIKLVRYKTCVLTGKDAFIEYWKGAWKSNLSKSSTHKTILQQCPYLGRVALYDIWDKSHKICFLAYMKDGRITHAVVLPEKFLNSLYLNNFQLDEPILDWDTLKRCMGEIVEPEANHIPCLECGTLSEDLEWHKFTYRMGLHGYEGIMSICPNCVKEVEMYAEMRVRYDSFDDEEEDVKDGESNERGEVDSPKDVDSKTDLPF